MTPDLASLFASLATLATLLATLPKIACGLRKRQNRDARVATYGEQLPISEPERNGGHRGPWWALRQIPESCVPCVPATPPCLLLVGPMNTPAPHSITTEASTS